MSDRYSVDKVLEKSNYGVLCLARDQARYGEICLLTKISYGELQQAELFEQKIEKKLRSFSTLKHLQIQQIQEYSFQSRNLLIVQDYTPGVSCRRKLSNDASLDEYSVIQLISKLLPALSYLHDNNVAHGNISLDNILIRQKDGWPMLTSFTCLKKVEEEIKRFLASDRFQNATSSLESDLQKDFHDLAIAALELRTGKIGAELCQKNNNNTGWIWEQWKLFSDQRSTVLASMLSGGSNNRSSTANAILQALNTELPAPYERNPIHPAWYMAIGILFVMGIAGTLFSKISEPSEQLSIPSPQLSPEPEILCPENLNSLPIGCGIAVQDPDSFDFNEGTLVVNITENASSDDRLSIIQQNVAVEEIDDEQTILFRETVIGSFTGGIGESPLKFSFNENTDAEVVRALLSDIVYENLADSPSRSSRKVEFKFTDGDGGESKVLTTTIGIYPVNSPPSLTVPSGKETKEDHQFAIGDIKVADVDTEDLLMGIGLQANQGLLRIKNNIEGGITGRNIERNGENSVVIFGTIEQLNNTLGSPEGIIYQPNANFSGKDTLTITVKDAGKELEGDEQWIWPPNALAPQTARKSVPITIQAINDPPRLSFAADTELAEEVEPPQPANTNNATISGDPRFTKNVRSGTNTNTRVLFELSVGDRVQIVDRARNSDGYLWYKIYSPQYDGEGWIASHLITLD